MSTLNLIVAASADDAFQSSSTAVSITGTTATVDAAAEYFGFRFLDAGIGALANATINTATLTVNLTSSAFDDANIDIHCEDGVGPATFVATNNNISARSLTTAKTTWNASSLGTGDKTQSIVSAVQEVADLGGTITALAVICVGITGANLRVNMYDGSTTLCARLDIDYTAGGGTETPQAVGGTLTSSGAVLKQTGKPLAGTLTTAGAVLKSVGKVVAGTLTSAGATIKQTGKTLAGTLTSAGDAVKQTGKILAGELTSSGTLETIRTFLVSVGGTLTSAGGLVKQTGKGLAGTLDSSGALLKSTARALGGTLTTAGDLTKQTGKPLAGVLDSSGGLVRSIGKALGGTLTSAGSLIKSTAKALAGVLSSAGSLAAEIVGEAATGIIHLTARARDFSLTATARDFALAAKARIFNLTVDDRD
jgi:hypothetical protein